MRTITIDEARSDLPNVLDEVAAGAEIIISRNDKPVARLVRLSEEAPRPLRRVGETRGPKFQIPDEAFAPLTDEELKEWGL